jgi:hypothetical protein
MNDDVVQRYRELMDELFGLRALGMITDDDEERYAVARRRHYEPSAVEATTVESVA